MNDRQRPSSAQAAASGDRTGSREAADSLVIVAKQLGADEDAAVAALHDAWMRL